MANIGDISVNVDKPGNNGPSDSRYSYPGQPMQSYSKPSMPLAQNTIPAVTTRVVRSTHNPTYSGVPYSSPNHTSSPRVYASPAVSASPAAVSASPTVSASSTVSASPEMSRAPKTPIPEPIIKGDNTITDETLLATTVLENAFDGMNNLLNNVNNITANNTDGIQAGYNFNKNSTAFISAIASISKAARTGLTVNANTSGLEGVGLFAQFVPFNKTYMTIKLAGESINKHFLLASEFYSKYNLFNYKALKVSPIFQARYSNFIVNQEEDKSFADGIYTMLQVGRGFDVDAVIRNVLGRRVTAKASLLGYYDVIKSGANFDQHFAKNNNSYNVELKFMASTNIFSKLKSSLELISEFGTSNSPSIKMGLYFTYTLA